MLKNQSYEQQQIQFAFLLQKPKKHSGSALPIYMRISVGCERTEISAQRKWDPTRWNAAAGRASGTKEDARALNAYLDTLQTKVYEAQRQLIADYEEITADAQSQRLVGGKRGKARMLIEIFQTHNDELAQLVGKDGAEGTLERYNTALTHAVAFLQWKFKADDIDILDLNYEFATAFEFWLMSEQGCSHNPFHYP